MNFRTAPWLAGLLAAALAAQATPPPAAPPVDPLLPTLLKDLKSMVANPKMEDDFRAIGLIQKLAADYAKMAPADQQKACKALGDVFKTGKVRPPDKPHLYQEASGALGQMGEDGAKELAKAVQDARVKDRDYAALRARMIVDLGKTKDEKQIEWLLEQARRSPSNDVMAAAGEALGNFTKLENKRRREVVKDLLNKYGEVHAKATAPEPSDPKAPIDFSPQNARETLAKIEGKWQATLRALTGQNFTNFADWQRWQNKNPNWTAPKAP